MPLRRLDVVLGVLAAVSSSANANPRRSLIVSAHTTRRCHNANCILEEDSVSDRIEKFIDELEAATDARERQMRSKVLVEQSERRAGRLAESLEALAETGFSTGAVTLDDVHALRVELAAVRDAAPLDPLIANAKALLTVVEDGLVDGDGSRLRAALARAEELASATARPRGEGQPHLASPIKVRCTSCETIVVGRRRGGVNWNAVTKELRDHERERHGEYSTELRDDMRRAHERLDAGEALVEAGRYQLGSL